MRVRLDNVLRRLEVGKMCKKAVVASILRSCSLRILKGNLQRSDVIQYLPLFDTSFELQGVVDII